MNDSPPEFHKYKAERKCCYVEITGLGLRNLFLSLQRKHNSSSSSGWSRLATGCWMLISRKPWQWGREGGRLAVCCVGNKCSSVPVFHLCRLDVWWAPLCSLDWEERQAGSAHLTSPHQAVLSFLHRDLSHCHTVTLSHCHTVTGPHDHLNLTISHVIQDSE